MPSLPHQTVERNKLRGRDRIRVEIGNALQETDPLERNHMHHQHRTPSSLTIKHISDRQGVLGKTVYLLEEVISILQSKHTDNNTLTPCPTTVWKAKLTRSTAAFINNTTQKMLLYASYNKNAERSIRQWLFPSLSLIVQACNLLCAPIVPVHYSCFSITSNISSSDAYSDTLGGLYFLHKHVS